MPKIYKGENNMKNQKILILTGVLLLAGLAGCGNPSSSSQPNNPSSNAPTSSEKTGMTESDAEAIIAGFDTTLTGTVKATYHPDYVLDVISTNASFLAYAEDIDAEIDIEADFTEGDLYLHVAKNDESLALVYEGEDGYYYLENTMGDPVKLANEEAALTKIYDLIRKASYSKAGWINPETFLYTGGLSYEHKQFLLDNENVDAISMGRYASFEENENGGLKVKADLDFVGFVGDSNILELCPTDDGFAEGKVGSKVELETDEKGHVVSFTNTYEEAQLVMALDPDNPPTIVLSGSHSLQAEYGSTLEKKDTIPHEAKFGTIKYDAVDKNARGFIEVYTCKNGKFNEMTAYKSGAEAQVGDVLCVKVTAATGNNILYVTYAGSSTPMIDPAMANGFYCFEIKDGEYNLGVTFEGNAKNATKLNIEVKKDANVSAADLTWFTMANPTITGLTPITDNVLDLESHEMGEWLAVCPTFAEGYALDSITFNGGKPNYVADFGGVKYYCYEAKLPKDISVNITSKAA